MYGKWVVINLGEDIKCKVWVACLPDTPEDILQRRALNQLQRRLPEKKTGIAAYGDAMQKIEDYEYSQGRGFRYNAEQFLKKLMEGNTHEKN
ncbi:hypothetical protein [Paenibacillus pini]|uniref:Uncharacterized protein n=1 Tax=Paenibacillus pini JCM 16418 TaxID=1236976 RepID=W7Z8T4_9BACL|nr:hypothetical protein [Paenibacillus pini]GAF10869.1 hypothetical protein JCM16418_5097 [Paenibacillus pini JCM 16418]